MEYSLSTNPRDTYKLVENLTTGTFENEIELLKSLAEEIADNPEFEIIGSRIWELDPDENTYTLIDQFGKVERIPDNYSFDITEQEEILAKVLEERVTLNYETDKLLKEKGILKYSVTGVGEIIKTSTGKYYKYLLGFNAPEILQSFFETLSVISSVATVALRNLSSEAEKQRFTREMDTASEIQSNLLPEHRMRFHDYDIFGVCIPDDVVGGDYFDYFMQSDEEDDNVGIVISDAASKGLSAAIQALFVSGAIRMGKRFSPSITHLMSALNTLIYDTFTFERFVTLFYCELTSSKNRLVLYANAGHCPPIHYRPSRDQLTMLDSTGGLLGLMKYQKFGMENLSMRPGDLLVLYTDGIIEARNKKGELFGEGRLKELVLEFHKETPEMIADRIIEEVQKFTAGSLLTDDKTLVVIKRDEKSETKK